MERTYLELNFPNLVTVMIMVAVGTMLVGTVSKAVTTYVLPRAE